MKILKRALFIVTILGSICGCSLFEGVLPDREKEYKYSSEIPPLEVPPELSTSTIEKSPIPPLPGGASPGIDSSPVQPAPKPRDQLPETTQVEEPGPDVERSPNDAYVSIREGFPIAWRMVGRALSRLEIEVEDLNRSEGLYYIIFEDRVGGAEKDSFLSKLAFWSSAGQDEELRFRVLVDDKEENTEVRILNEEGKVLSQGPGLDLLRQIQSKINEQRAEK